MRIFSAAVFAALLFVVAGASTATRWDEAHQANPILPGYFADPSLLLAGGKNYVYATLDPWGGETLGCWESPDFKQWTYRELNWPTKSACTSPTSGGSKVWAPSVVQAPSGQFYMYVSVGSEVWVGTADQPLGPWRDANGGRPLIPGNARPGFHMIDAEAFVDDDGRAYLYWGSGWEWKNGRCFAVKLKADMVTFDGEPSDVTPANYFEGPFMFKREGRYFLSYSQGVTIKDSYQVRYAIGDSPLGPFTEAANSPLLVTDAARNVVSPGHHAFFTRDGHAYILYHRHSVPSIPEQAFRQTCVDEVTFTTEGLMAKVVPTHTGPALVQGREEGIPNLRPTSASASSSVDEVHGAGRVLDDNYATRWAPASDAREPWLQLDFGETKPLGRSTIRFEYAWKEYRYDLQISDDGVAWHELADHRTQGLRGSPQTEVLDTHGRFIRINFAADDANTIPSVIEWRVE